eukprot:Clim_evm6s200 gene=Clim_evmTU6s200
MANIRRRASRRAATPKTTSKRKHTQTRKLKKVTVADPTIAKAWDRKKSIRENFRAMGLAANPNDSFLRKGGAQQVLSVPQEDAVGTLGEDGEVHIVNDKSKLSKGVTVQSEIVEELERRAKEDSDRVWYYHMSEGDFRFAEAVVKKYGKNFSKASRDIKLNYNQLTPNQIKKKVEKFEKEVEMIKANTFVKQKHGIQEDTEDEHSG